MLEAAITQLAIEETPGTSVTWQIDSFAKAVGYDLKSDERDNWCGIFLGWCALQTGHAMPEKPWGARQWLKVGDPVEYPQVGDVVVLSRPGASWMGHVGLYLRMEGDYVWLLGGNQGGKVKASKYEASRILGYRRPLRLLHKR